MAQHDKLATYGYSFQTKLIAALLTDKTFLKQCIDILEIKYFESEANSWIVSSINEHFEKFKVAPTLEVLKVKLQDVTNDVLRASIIEQLRESWKHIESTDLDFIKDKTIDFCKNQTIKGAILQSVDLLKTGNYDQIKSLVDNAMKVGVEKDIGHDYAEDIEERFSESARVTVETPWTSINEIMDGGLGPGELGVFEAPAGVGKTWGLVNVGVNAIQKGLTVIHYTMELNQAYVGLRYDARLTGLPAQDLKFNKETVIEEVGKLPGELIIKYFPTKTASITTINSHLERCILQDKKPDLIIVDYADLLRGNFLGGELRHELGNIYEDLRGLAGESEIPVWTASQANRSALEEDIIEAQKISESYAKIMIADFVISLSRKIADKVANTGRWHIIKNRFGPDGLTFPSKMDTSTGIIHIFDEMSIGGKEQQKKMDNSSEYLRKMLSKKLKDSTT